MMFLSIFKSGWLLMRGNYLHKSMVGKFDENTIMNSGLFNLAENNLVYDAFQNRIMFPLTNDSGQVVAFSGRIWQEAASDGHQAKYKKQSQHRYFQ